MQNVLLYLPCFAYPFPNIRRTFFLEFKSALRILSPHNEQTNQFGQESGHLFYSGTLQSDDRYSGIYPLDNIRMGRSSFKQTAKVCRKCRVCSFLTIEISVFPKELEAFSIISLYSETHLKRISMMCKRNLSRLRSHSSKHSCLPV